MIVVLALTLLTSSQVRSVLPFRSTFNQAYRTWKRGFAHNFFLQLFNNSSGNLDRSFKVTRSDISVLGGVCKF